MSPHRLPPEPYALTAKFWGITFLVGLGLALGYAAAEQILIMLREV